MCVYHGFAAMNLELSISEHSIGLGALSRAPSPENVLGIPNTHPS